LSIGFQKDFLGDVFHLAALTKELAGDLKDARTVAADDLLESVLITRARELYQLLVGNLGNRLRQGQPRYSKN